MILFYSRTTGPIKDAEKQTKLSFDNMRKHVNTYGTMAVASAAAVGAGIFAMANEYAKKIRHSIVPYLINGLALSPSEDLAY
ncbi:hypothetical protein [Acinetobacter lwoffii]|jgi:hypothetical protein|uniref:hypothetical protein n=1 Tax=Acinetobacter lwoffii TaxID=28090 RepID=UPI00343EE8FD